MSTAEPQMPDSEQQDSASDEKLAALPDERIDVAQAAEMPTIAGSPAQDEDLLAGIAGSVEPPD